MKALVAAFEDEDAILAGARQARAQGFAVLDALTPYPVTPIGDFLGRGSPRIRVPMAVAGFGAAVLLFAFEAWTAIAAYPINEGGRPAFSWPVFLLSPFEVGVLAAAIAGMAAFLIQCGLPRLNHPLFLVPGIERASQDRFHLVVDPVSGERAPALRALLFGAGAVMVSEAEA